MMLHPDGECVSTQQRGGVEESDLKSTRLWIHKRYSHQAQSAQSSPGYKTKNPKGFVKTCTTTNTLQPQARVLTEQRLPPTNSFSAALKECHNRKLERGLDVPVHRGTIPDYEDFVRQSQPISTPYRFKERKRPASMDLVADQINFKEGYNYSSKTLKESTGGKTAINQSDYYDKQDSQRSASGKVRSFPSPDTPSVKGLSSANSWSYERVSMAANTYRNRPLPRQTMSMKNLPSKWDDAEKWLCSPASASADSPANAYYHRKPKSKSGPLVVMEAASQARPLYYSRTKASTGQDFYHSSGPPHTANTENGVMEPRSRPENGVVLEGKQPSDDFQINSEDNKLAKPEIEIIGGRPSITRCASVDGWSFQAMDMPRIQKTTIPKEGNADTQCTLNRSRSTREVMSVPIFSDMLTQDKYADTVLETPRLYGPTSSIKEEMVDVVYPTKHGNCGSSMKAAVTDISPTILKRDMATQMTPLGSSKTSRCTTPMKSNSPIRHNTPARESDSESNSTLDISELQTLAKLDIRDDHNQPKVFTPGKKAISSWSTREEEEEESSKCLRYFDVVGDWKKNIMEARAAAWEEAERSKCLARFKREAAKITAWENHEKAKAEAELKKLEMKVEKIRSHATEKIMNKLSGAHEKAENMRVTLAAQQAEQLAKTMERAASIRTKSDHVGTLGACFFM